MVQLHQTLCMLHGFYVDGCWMRARWGGGIVCGLPTCQFNYLSHKVYVMHICPCCVCHRRARYSTHSSSMDVPHPEYLYTSFCVRHLYLQSITRKSKAADRALTFSEYGCCCVGFISI